MYLHKTKWCILCETQKHKHKTHFLASTLHALFALNWRISNAVCSGVFVFLCSCCIERTLLCYKLHSILVKSAFYPLLGWSEFITSLAHASWTHSWGSCTVDHTYIYMVHLNIWAFEHQNVWIFKHLNTKILELSSMLTVKYNRYGPWSFSGSSW